MTRAQGQISVGVSLTPLQRAMVARCFADGARMEDLAVLLLVDLDEIEAIIREAMRKETACVPC